MTGYLQRIVASAANVGAIHPVLRPLYSSGANAMPDDAAGGPADLPPALAAPRQPEADVRRDGDRPLPSATRPDAPPIPQATSLARNLLPGLVTHRAAVGAVDQASGPAPPTLEEPRPVPGNAPAARMREAAESPAVSERRFAPLVRASAQRESAPHALRDDPPPWPRSVAARNDRPAIAAAARRQAAEPDNVEIHIGRIEVTAVQPARPAPAKPARHAPSLEDYLKRRNGRAS